MGFLQFPKCNKEDNYSEQLARHRSVKYACIAREREIYSAVSM